MKSSSSPNRSGSPQKPSLEPLEARLMLAASVLPKTLPWQGTELTVAAGRWLVQLDNITGPRADQVTSATKLVRRAAISAVRVEQQLGADGLFLMNSPASWTAQQALSQFGRLPGYRYAEPDQLLQLTATFPNDPYFSSLWGLHNTGQSGGVVDNDIDAPEAWDYTRGSTNTVVGIIDTGIDYNHTDLSANVWINPGEIAGNSIDDDANGYIDDIRGWDFGDNDNNPMDTNGHGTHVAGTVAAVGNNGVGVTGVNWNSKVMPLKIMDSTGTMYTSYAVSALNYVANMKNNKGINIRVTNNSWGGGSYSSTLYNAINANRSASIIFVAAAGNGGPDYIGDDNDIYPFYPASYNLDNIIAVANLTRFNVLDTSSNYGLVSVDLAAPGTDIRSTVPGNSYAWYSGTSMASPHVAGVAALAFTLKPSATYSEVRTAIFNGVDPVASLSGKVATGGRLNAFNTLSFFAGVPSVPDLLASSDTGVSNTDNVTYDNTPTFTGTAPAGNTVRIFADTIEVGSGVATGGTWNITTSVLADGVRSITATSQPPGGSQSQPSAPLLVTIDTVAPTVVGSPSFIYQNWPQRLSYNFSEDVGWLLGTEDLSLQNTTLGQSIPPGNISVSYNGGTYVATFTFPGYANGALPDGNYTATVLSSGVTDLAGNPLASNQTGFFTLIGDANHDRVVDISDLGILATNWQQAPRDFTQGDFTYNNLVDISDLGLLATNWQVSLSVPGAVVSGASSGQWPPPANAPLRSPFSEAAVSNVSLDLEELLAAV